MSGDASSTEFTPTQADMVAFYRRQGSDRLRSWLMLVGGLLMSFGAFLLLVVALPFHRDVWLGPVAVASVLIGFGVPIAAFRWRMRNLARRIHQQQVSLRSPVRMRWSDAGLGVETPTGSSLTPWSHYHRWREDKAVILLQHSELLAQFIPKRALSAEGLAALRACARQGGVPGSPAA